MRNGRRCDDHRIEVLQLQGLTIVADVADAGNLAETGADKGAGIDDGDDFDAVEPVRDG